MELLIVWLIGFILSGAFFIFRMSGKSGLGFSTEDNTFLLSILVMSAVWPVSLVAIGATKLRSARG